MIMLLDASCCSLQLEHMFQKIFFQSGGIPHLNMHMMSF